MAREEAERSEVIAWNHTAAVIAAVVNASPNRGKSRAVSPDDIYPRDLKAIRSRRDRGEQLEEEDVEPAAVVVPFATMRQIFGLAAGDDRPRKLAKRRKAK